MASPLIGRCSFCSEADHLRQTLAGELFALKQPWFADAMLQADFLFEGDTRTLIVSVPLDDPQLIRSFNSFLNMAVLRAGFSVTGAQAVLA